MIIGLFIYALIFIGIGLLFAIPAFARTVEDRAGKAYWAMLALMAQVGPPDWATNRFPVSSGIK